MPIQTDPSFIDSVKAQAFRARLRAIYNAPSAIPAQRFNVQQPLPAVPYTNSSSFPSYLDAQIKANPAPPPPTKTALTTPTPTSAPITLPPTTNPVPRIAPPPGSGGAAVVTLTGGGVISGAGLLTGGLATLAGGLLIYNAHQLYKLYRLSQPEPKPKPFPSGQQPNIYYDVHLRQKYNPNIGYQESNNLLIYPDILGSIVGLYTGDPDGVYILHNSGKDKFFIYSTTGQPNAATVENTGMVIEKVVRSDGQVEPTPTDQPKRSPIKPGIAPSPTPQSISSPNPKGVRSPTSPPAPADIPLATNNRIPYTIVTPGSNPITITSPGAAPVTISPAGTPATIKITRPSASPFLSPTPASTPKATPITTPIGDPVITPAGVPIAVSSPGSTPTNLVMPGANPITITYPGQAPIVIDPTGFKLPQGVQAAPIPKPGAFTTTPAALPQTPTNPVITPTKPGTPTAPIIPGVEEPDVKDILIKLAALTGLIQGVNKNTTPAAIQNAVAPAIAPAVCSTTAPGGCSSNAMNRAVNQGNQDLLAKLGLGGGQAIDLLTLAKIDDKLGNKITGGLSGGISRMSTFLGIDRALNLLNFLATLHNASMLSSSLKVTLLETLSSIGNATGLLQSSEGENVELNKVFDQGIETFITKIIGVDKWASMKLEWRKYSSIYRAGSNVLSNVGNMFSSIGNGIEEIGERSGKIGNALRAAGAIRENAFPVMSESMTVHTNKFMSFQTKIGGATEFVEAINEVAESVIEGQESFTEATKAATEFKKQLAVAEKNPLAGSDAIKAEAEKVKANLVKDPTGEDEQGLLSFLTDL